MEVNKNIKIAFISLEQEEAERVPPFGFVYLATYLRDIDGIPHECIKIIDENFMNIDKELEQFRPDIIGFTSMTVHYTKTIQLAKKLREVYKIPFILGGVHISSLPLSLDNVFDIGVIGEGELTLSELIKIYKEKKHFTVEDLKTVQSIVYHQNNKVIENPVRKPIENLDDLPIPDFKWVSDRYFEREEIPAISDTAIKCYLLSSRGCPYRCVFCSTAKFWGRMRFHSADYTARIVKKCIDDYGTDHIRVMDDLFTVSPKRLREIKEAFEKYGVLDKIKSVECQPRANLMTDELCVAMKDLKIKTINFGFESGSDHTLKWLKAGSASVEMNKNAIILGRKYGFNIYGSLMYGSPHETIQDMEETNKFIDFAIKNRAKHIWSFIATPFPATEFWNIALERGKVSNDMDWSLLSHQNIDKPLLLDEDIDIEDFKRVFLKGRKKLRKMKIKLVVDLVLRHPLKAIWKVLREPLLIFKVFKMIKQ